MRKKKHWLSVQIECLDPQGKKAALERLHRWLEIFGHTAPSHGFQFLESGPELEEDD